MRFSGIKLLKHEKALFCYGWFYVLYTERRHKSKHHQQFKEASLNSKPDLNQAFNLINRAVLYTLSFASTELESMFFESISVRGSFFFFNIFHTKQLLLWDDEYQQILNIFIYRYRS